MWGLGMVHDLLSSDKNILIWVIIFLVQGMLSEAYSLFTEAYSILQQA